MFWIRHPQPLLSTKAVAMQVVARKAQALRATDIIVLERRKPDAPTVEDGNHIILATIDTIS